MNIDHLTDEQWTAALAGDPWGTELDEHLRNCAHCDAERQKMIGLLGHMRHQIASRAERPAAFWNWQLESTLRRIHPRRKSLARALAGTLALLAVALLLFQWPRDVNSPDSWPQSAAVVPQPPSAASARIMSQGETTSASPALDPRSAQPPLNLSDAVLITEIQRALQGPPVALEPAALLAQELMAAQISAASATDSPSSKGEMQ